MTISNSASSTTAHCNGAETNFSYNFLVPVGAGYQLTQTDQYGDVTLIPNSAYTVTGIGQPTGGNFIYAPGGVPVASGNFLTFTRFVPYVQNTSLANQGTYYPATVEAALDWLEMQIQQLVNGLTPLGVLPTTLPSTAGQLWNNNGYVCIS